MTIYDGKPGFRDPGTSSTVGLHASVRTTTASQEEE